MSVSSREDILNPNLVGYFLFVKKGLKFKLLKNFTEMLRHFLSTVIVKAIEWSRELAGDYLNILEEKGTTFPIHVSRRDLITSGPLILSL